MGLSELFWEESSDYGPDHGSDGDDSDTGQEIFNGCVSIPNGRRKEG